MKVVLPQLKCPKCGHTWVPRKAEIRKCPRCKNVLMRFSLEELLIPKGSE